MDANAPQPESSSELSEAPPSKWALAAWGLAFVSPGLCAALGGTAALAFSTVSAFGFQAKALVALACWALLAANAGVLASGRVRRWAWRERWGLALMAASTLFALALAEAALRVWLPAPLEEYQKTVLRRDPDLGVEHVPNSSGRHQWVGVFDVLYNVNSLGARGQEPALEPGKPLILAVGCSQTFGLGVDGAEAWPARLEALLAGEAAVVNRGVIADGLPQMWLRAKRFAEEGPKPDLILVGAAPIHLYRSGVTPWWNERDGGGYPLPVLGLGEGGRVEVARMVSEALPARSLADRTYKRLRLYQLARPVLLGAASRIAGAKPSPGAPWWGRTANDPAAWEALDLSIKAFGQLREEAGVPVAVVLLPPSDQLSPEQREEFDGRLAEACRREGLPLWDIGPEVARSMDGAPLALSPQNNELHYNAAACAAIAEALAPLAKAALEQEEP